MAPAVGQSRTKVVYSFGREDQLDRAAISRLVIALSRLLDPAAALTATADVELALTGPSPVGGVHFWTACGAGSAWTP
ncbi:hypothetical protein GCM10009577_01950 [Streptomyces javensis]